jgi:predicted oxidoreductase (fatty acid repression mutant protein)
MDTLRETLSGETLARAEARFKNGLAVSSICPRFGNWGAGDTLVSLQPGHGTILFFADRATVTEAKSSRPSYAYGFDAWATQSQGNLQGTTWTALSLEGMGASLQYYHVYAGVSEAIRKMWDIPETWGKFLFLFQW